MGELKIIGAQRVKALIDVLHGQRNAEISKCVRASRTTVLEKLEESYPGITAATEFVKQVYGSTPYDNNGSPYDKVETELNREYERQCKEIREKYEKKETELWLCETLEQAKAIVYGTPTEN